MPNPVGYHTAHVSWPGVQGALPGGAPAYEFRINGGASETDYVTGSDGTVFADADGLILGNNTFEARALVGTDGVQAWSGWSSATIVRTAAAPIGAVPAPAASPNPAPAGTTSVIWSQTEGAIRYEYKVGDGPIVATANANPSAIVSGLKGYATVSVRAVTATTVGPWGSVRVLAPPPKPTGLTSTPNPLPAGSGRADISWNVVPEADGYMTRFDGNTIDARIVGGRDNTLIYLQVYGYLPTFTYEVRAYADGIYPQRLYSDWVLVTVVMLPSDD
jgi:hypothetical protein